MAPTCSTWRSPKGYLIKRLSIGVVKSYIGRHEPEILTHLELVVNTVSMGGGGSAAATTGN